ncbi:hypothetical protein HYPP_03781 [Hyphomicrobium sp. ghe19]|nr:hypothetical protein HYPP_03781 [Hyphomicrobium sp. ghe19]
MLVAGGQGEEDIARVIGVSRGTLRKFFKEELATGAAKRRGEVLLAQYRAAVAGNASAQEKFLRKGEITSAADRVAPSEKPGKKEAMQTAASNVTGKFAPPPAPKLVVNNA